MLQEFHEAARRAHYWTSFDPEKRGVQTIETYEQVLADDLKIIEDARQEVKDLYVQRFKKHFSHWLSARSRCYSVMITGGSNFNNRRHEKYNNWERSAYEKFDEYRSKAKNGILRQIEREKSPEQKANEEWQRIEANIRRRIDGGYSRVLLAQMIERIARRGDVENTEKAIELIKEAGEKNGKPLYTSRHSIWGFVELAKKTSYELTERANAENKEKEVNGIKVVRNYEADRLQLIFPDKPEDDVRRLLKSNGFRWSYRYGAWQRQLTNNAEWAAKRVLKEVNKV